MLSDSALAQVLPRLIKPYDERLLNPASYDVRLSSVLRIPRTRSIFEDGPLDVADIPEKHTRLYDMATDGDQWVLHPGDFVLGATQEVIGVPVSMVARVEGKSSLGRLGLAVHITAGYIDPGFCGSITLEIANLFTCPIRIRSGMRIAQIAYQPVTGVVNHPYGERGHYQFQAAGVPVQSRYTMGDLP